MPRYKNVSPQGDMDLPLIGGVVASGEVFDADEGQAALLDLQPALWRRLPDKPAEHASTASKKPAKASDSDKEERA